MVEVAPSFSSVLRDCTIIEGQDFVLQCSVKGTPVPRITWLLNGESPAPVPVALPAFSLDFPIDHSEPCLPNKEAQVQRENGTWESATAWLGIPGKLLLLSEP